MIHQRDYIWVKEWLEGTYKDSELKCEWKAGDGCYFYWITGKDFVRKSLQVYGFAGIDYNVNKIEDTKQREGKREGLKKSILEKLGMEIPVKEKAHEQAIEPVHGVRGKGKLSKSGV